MSVTIRIGTNEINRLLERLGDVAEETVRPAAQAAAEIIRDEARRLAGRSKRPHWFYGTSYRPRKSVKNTPSSNKSIKYLFYPGTLKKSIYQVYSKDRSTPTRAVYHVSWNLKEAPYGIFVEYGLSPFISKSTPFLRPAIVNKYQAAVDAMTEVVAQKLGEL